jgi:hypothetical protein
MGPCGALLNRLSIGATLPFTFCLLPFLRPWIYGHSLKSECLPANVVELRTRILAEVTSQILCSVWQEIR